jgi:carbon-monoxide dehydrogenase small subunit
MTDFTLINGHCVPLDPQWPERRLLDILRQDLNLTGAKPGCRVGRCGACTVLVSGLPVPSCLVLSGKLKGLSVITIESMPTSSPVREALVSQGGFQCGYCTAGLVMSIEYWYSQDPRPPREAVEDLLVGHLCRCTGYAGIRRALDILF